MAWTYRQSSGELLDAADEVIGHAYSGSGPGRNNPAMQDQENVGPICRGFYTMLPPADTPSHGPYVLRLIPAPSNEMHGRAGFLCHGDRVHALPGLASNGCIVAARDLREALWHSNDHQIEVVA